MKPDTMDSVFAALAHPARRHMLDILVGMPGCSVNDVAKYVITRFPMSRIGVLKHLRVLEQAGLVVSQKQGRVRELYFNAAPIQLVYDRWTSQYSRFWAAHVNDIKFLAEQEEETGHER